MAKKTSDSETQLDFEASLKELEELVEKMEQGDLTLEQSLKDFERGVALTRACQQALREAEQKVQILADKSDQAELSPFEDKEA
ncbi:MAG: exodeoxyribonuclease VII small subunit [Gammaproteobacteria bacterium]|nr:exodeoxyribonuclease VII small subunit [Gammaproteobacteria bacterium]MCW8841640.1 exodeoxyribonuclease VII small subunit [Gammaproteobacteria bacterium]MCW8928427.1 exodeoxyribonuclease VII small subunit [Gammaproteobacteria bacterium]MCW8959775.1 exodeoxyribonuclease VII small subunit [Gammaproteobacteria bacterium]MCW8972934.1 exodeoxyribonuclease VII small subunit [Gammaproteobacteria bacterium]